MLSITIISYNEAHCIETCLRSISWAEEIILVDCYSTDNTVDIVRKYTDKIFFQPNRINLNVNKSWAISQAKGDWIMYLDPDEVISTALAEEIKKVVTLPTAKSTLNAYYLPRKNYYFGYWLRYGGKYPDRQLRLFRREKAFFPCKHVHEKLCVQGHIGNLRSPLEHYSYRTINEFVRKFDFYTTFQAMYWYQELKFKPSWRLFWQYNFFTPVRRFIDRYLLKLGFLDRFPGFFAAVCESLLWAVAYAKLWEFCLKEKSNSK